MEAQEQTAEQLRASLVKLASGHLDAGIIHEPRMFYDIIDLVPNQQITAGHPEVFKNGENFPVRLTHMIASVARLDSQDPPVLGDERNLQRIGLRFTFHDQNYMNSLFQPVALWGNVHTAPGSISQALSTASWHFPVPFVLGTRDTLENRVELDGVPASAQLVSISYDGIGMLSGRPYLLSNTVSLDDAQETALGTTFYRNDGSEPIIVASMTAQTTGPIDADDPTGDIRTLSLQVKQIGNGTQAKWFEGPITPTIDLMPAPLLGITTSGTLVHRFPGAGILWEPDEGLNVSVRALVPDNQSIEFSRLQIALAGYITIT